MAVFESLKRARELFLSQGDKWGAHLCDIAIARESVAPAEALLSVLGPLGRLAETGSLTGIDVILAEVMYAARAVGGSDVEEKARRIVVNAGRLDLAARVLAALWEKVETLLALREIEGAKVAAWAALELAVALEDFSAAGISLLRLAGCHEADVGGVGQEVASLCLEQAGQYFLRAGRYVEAGHAFLEAGGWELDDTQEIRLRVGVDKGRAIRMLEEARSAFEAAGDVKMVVFCLVAVAETELGEGRDGLRALQKAAGLLESANDLETEAKVWRMLAQAYVRAGNKAAAEAAAARAMILQRVVQEGIRRD